MRTVWKKAVLFINEMDLFTNETDVHIKIPFFYVVVNDDVTNFGHFFFREGGDV